MVIAIAEDQNGKTQDSKQSDPCGASLDSTRFCLFTDTLQDSWDENAWFGSVSVLKPFPSFQESSPHERVVTTGVQTPLSEFTERLKCTPCTDLHRLNIMTFSFGL